MEPAKEKMNRSMLRNKLKYRMKMLEKEPKTCFSSIWTWRWNEKMEKIGTYENEEFGWWSHHLKCEGSKISELMPPLERTKALKMRQGRGEDKFSHTLSPIWESFATIILKSEFYKSPHLYL